MRTRETGPPTDSAAPAYTAAIDVPTLLATECTAGFAVVLRNSRMTVTGSGRAATYGTDALTSMTSDVTFELTRKLMSLIRAVAAGPPDWPDAFTSAPTTNAVSRRGSACVRLILWRPRAIAAVCESRAADRKSTRLNS